MLLSLMAVMRALTGSDCAAPSNRTSTCSLISDVHYCHQFLPSAFLSTTRSDEAREMFLVPRAVWICDFAAPGDRTPTCSLLVMYINVVPSIPVPI